MSDDNLRFEIGHVLFIDIVEINLTGFTRACRNRCMPTPRVTATCPGVQAPEFHEASRLLGRAAPSVSLRPACGLRAISTFFT